MENLKMDILALLQENSKVDAKQMALLLGKKEKEIVATIKEMEEHKVILKYTTMINWEKTGEEYVTALIDVKVQPQRGVGFDTVAERIYRFPEVKSVYLMSGGYDLSLIIEGKTMKEVALFVAEKLATIENVQSTTTHFVLKKYKEKGVIYEDKEEDRRLVISP
ncbi:MAG: Lrp/AsnC family transcriptional regulator [Clostridia bacterium]|jgi:DNA-binding Lrp family transcriptional regulator|nr:Lrp/AsnC family transcriptional regulator [Clostridia bacterium]